MKILKLTTVLLALWFTGLAADYREDVDRLMKRVEQLKLNDEGMDDESRFDELVQISYDYAMLNFPEFATFRGDPRGQDRWTDNSEAAFLRRREDQDLMIEALSSIDAAALDEAQRTNLKLLLDQQKRQVEGRRFPEHYVPLNQMAGQLVLKPV